MRRMALPAPERNHPRLAASFSALDTASASSSASTIRRSLGSVPEARIRIRPRPASSASTDWRAADRPAWVFQS